jgi:PAS domain S-box-containing protein
MELSSLFEHKTSIIAQIILATGSLLTASYKLFRVISKEITERKDMHNKINHILEELTPNHGSSIKDKINKMDSQLSENTLLTGRIFDRQRWILDNEDIIVFESDNDGKCVWANKKYCDWLKRDDKYFLGHGWKNAIHPDDRERTSEYWEECVADSRDSENLFRMVDRDGKIYNVYCIANKSTDNNGYMGTIKIVD